MASEGRDGLPAVPITVRPCPAPPDVSQLDPALHWQLSLCSSHVVSQSVTQSMTPCRLCMFATDLPAAMLLLAKSWSDCLDRSELVGAAQAAGMPVPVLLTV